MKFIKLVEYDGGNIITVNAETITSYKEISFAHINYVKPVIKTEICFTSGVIKTVKQSEKQIDALIGSNTKNVTIITVMFSGIMQSITSTTDWEKDFTDAIVEYWNDRTDKKPLSDFDLEEYLREKSFSDYGYEIHVYDVSI